MNLVQGSNAAYLTMSGQFRLFIEKSSQCGDTCSVTYKVFLSVGKKTNKHLMQEFPHYDDAYAYLEAIYDDFVNANTVVTKG